MSGRAASPPPPLVPEPVTPDDYEELLRHLNTQGHIVVLNWNVSERPKPTWGQLFARTNAPVPDDVLYKEDIKGLMDELKKAIKNGTMIPDSASKKLASINAMLHRIKSRSLTPSVGSSASTVSSPQQQSDQTPTDEDTWGWGPSIRSIINRALRRNQKKEEETQAHIDAQAKWENENPELARYLKAEAIRTAADLANLDHEKLLAEYQLYKLNGGLFDLDEWKRTRYLGTSANRWPDMTTPGDANKTQFGILYAKLANKLAMGGKSKRILKSRSKRSKRSKSNKGKKSHRRR